MFQFSIFSFYTEDNDWECCPVVECLPNTPEILDLILIFTTSIMLRNYAVIKLNYDFMIICINYISDGQ